MTGIVCSGISKRFGGTQALDQVDFAVRPGEVVALVGQNGAGKSTLVSVLAGAARPDSGEMSVDGTHYRPAEPADADRFGIALIHQETRLLPELTVAENVFLGRPLMKRFRIDLPRMITEAERSLQEFGVALDAGRRVGNLSIAAQQQVEIVKALRREPKYVVFDEPTASFGARETGKVIDHIKDLRARGVGVVYISHRLEEVLTLADRIVVLRNGRVVATYDRGQATQPDLVKAMVGHSVEEEFRRPPPAGDEIVLTVEDLGTDGVFDGINFQVRRGEILGVAGLVGARRTDVLRAIFGADRYDAGAVLVDGRPLAKGDPRAALRAGIAFVPEDRKAQGIVLGNDSWDNLSMPWMGQATRRGLLSPARVRDRGREIIETLDIRGNPDRPVSTLSGGNQQKIVIGKWLPHQPKVLLLDEPTRGVDIAAKESIYQAIYTLAEQGMAIVVVSSELEEVLGLSHRILVMAAGRQTAIIPRENADGNDVLTAAFQFTPAADAGAGLPPAGQSAAHTDGHATKSST